MFLEINLSKEKGDDQNINNAIVTRREHNQISAYIQLTITQYAAIRRRFTSQSNNNCLIHGLKSRYPVSPSCAVKSPCWQRMWVRFQAARKTSRILRLAKFSKPTTRHAVESRYRGWIDQSELHTHLSKACFSDRRAQALPNRYLWHNEILIIR